MRTYFRKFNWYLRVDGARKRFAASKFAKSYARPAFLWYAAASALVVWLIGFDVWHYTVGALIALFAYGLTFGSK